MKEDPASDVQNRHRTRLAMVIVAQTAVHNDAKSQEVAVAAQKQVQINSSHVMPNIFIDN